MEKTTVEIVKIKNNIEKLHSDEIYEVSKFVDSLLLNSVQSKNQKIQKLEGIWEGIGFEKIDIEKELSHIRSDIENSILKK